MTDDMQRAREQFEDWMLATYRCDLSRRGGVYLDLIAGMAWDAWNAALRAAPVGWSFQHQGDGSIIVTAEGYGVVHVRPDDSDSIAAAMLHLLASDLAARPKEVK